MAAVARQNFCEAVRDRVFYHLIGFTALVAGAAVLVSQISIAIENELLVNLGLTAISLTSVALAVLLGVGLVAKEIERRTVYAVLARPVARWELVGGKFCGLAATLAANVALMALALGAVMLSARSGAGTLAAMLPAVYFLFLQALMLVALALLFSSFTSPVLAAVFTLAMFGIGSSAADLRGVAQMVAGGARWLALAVVSALPDLSSFNVIAAAAHGEGASLQLVALNTLYTALYAGGALAGAAFVFSRRDLK
jgi:ABC-type transport system involved in multi-copper enzyme maturation permease subunit